MPQGSPCDAAISARQMDLLKSAEAELGNAQNLLKAKGEPDGEILYDLGTIARLKGDVSHFVPQRILDRLTAKLGF